MGTMLAGCQCNKGNQSKIPKISDTQMTNFFAVIILLFKQRGLCRWQLNSVDPDQTAPLGSGSALFEGLSRTLG